MRGYIVHYPGYCRTTTVALPTVTLLLNSMVSTSGAIYMTLDIKDFYVNTPMKRSEYIPMKLSDLPEDFIKQYKLAAKTTKDTYAYIKSYKVMYVLPPSGILAHMFLDQHLNEKGYRQSSLTPGYWKHYWIPTYFTLFVENFGVKYVVKEHAKHLSATLN